MRILLKCPTRTRPQRVIETLKLYMKLANNPAQIGVAVSCDVDDLSMTRNLVQEEIMNIINPAAWKRIFFSPNTSKIEACNANMTEIDWEWDIVVLVSDDMIPQIKGWDDVIRTYMLASFPDTDGILWFNDGYQKERLNTLCVFGRAMYTSFGYIYNPTYKSLFCDTELTDLCKSTLQSKCLYIPYCIIRHEHPGTGYTSKNDALYLANQRYWIPDMHAYINRKTYAYDWSILIPTMPGRETKLHSLMAAIREKISRICPDLRIEFCIAFDNREETTGTKRQRLLIQAKGKYLSCIDDDDTISDAYIEDLWECIKGGFDVMRLVGRIHPYTFQHSIETTLTDPMASGDVFMRPPNHLNPMLSDIAKIVPFKDLTRGEDLDWTLRMAQYGLLKTEYRGDISRIHYDYDLSRHKITIGPQALDLQRNMTYERLVELPAPAMEPRRDRQFRLGAKGFVSA